MSLPLAPSTSLTAVWAATTPSSPGLNSGTTCKCTEGRFTTTGLLWSGMSEARPADTRAARLMTWFAIVFALATDAVYLLLILGQGGTPNDIVTVAFVASYLAAL